MSLDKEKVRKVATLARIKMSEEELGHAQEKLNNIIGFIEQLAEVDTDNIEPLPSPVNIRLKLRKDEITDGGYAEDVLANAPEEMENFYVVPKVVE
ncbi:MAG: Asp-tRNA(Asn)/Glu-tRNA(Gln) amidotransferase GatCAB subunit C [Alphaproteobacteria bacterium CG_4_9_14_3_um_filter_47_13]|nr:MAG: Asp-tRNA(Asn)/Glu-tRNA(Gln) amidotransferase GatCAB subunit C [Alphaproteobacteria bacterium CG_4_9_14_3_um_filter_47_13]